MPNLGAFHITQKKFEYAGEFLRLDIPFILMRHENGAIRERSSN